MSRTSLGRTVIVAKGEYNPNAIYRRLDLITYQGQSYIVTAESITGAIPTPTSAGYQLIAKKGQGGVLPKESKAPVLGLNTQCEANKMTVIDFTDFEGVTGTITPTGAIGDYDNEWGITVIQGATAKPITLPSITWGLGIAPTFGADSTTVMRLYYVGEVLCGEWVSV